MSKFLSAQDACTRAAPTAPATLFARPQSCWEAIGHFALCLRELGGQALARLLQFLRHSVVVTRPLEGQIVDDHPDLHRGIQSAQLFACHGQLDMPRYSCTAAGAAGSSCTLRRQSASDTPLIGSFEQIVQEWPLHAHPRPVAQVPDGPDASCSLRHEDGSIAEVGPFAFGLNEHGDRQRLSPFVRQLAERSRKYRIIPSPVLARNVLSNLRIASAKSQ